MPFSPETQKNNYFLFNWLNDQVPVFKRFTKILFILQTGHTIPAIISIDLTIGISCT